MDSAQNVTRMQRETKTKNLSASESNPVYDDQRKNEQEEFKG